MQANSRNHQTASDNLLQIASDFVSPDAENLALESIETHKPIAFHSQSSSSMAMNAAPDIVASYLDDHSSWFHRCAQPMLVEAIGKNGYGLRIGRFGAFGYEVEPCIGLELLPQQAGIYRIQTIPVPDAQFLGYEVDFQAALELFEVNTGGQVTTEVQWELDLTVLIQFPAFIHALPLGLIQSTGDRLISQIVRQVSRRLTRKVQHDFHSSLGLPQPRRQRGRKA
ncbi:MAG: DUF1997 domain-containing protein [Elainellaceae cyanobacterium]